MNQLIYALAEIAPIPETETRQYMLDEIRRLVDRVPCSLIYNVVYHLARALDYKPPLDFPPSDTPTFATFVRYGVVAVDDFEAVLRRLDPDQLPGRTFEYLGVANFCESFGFYDWPRKNVVALARTLPATGCVHIISHQAAIHLRYWGEWPDWCAAHLYVLISMQVDGYMHIAEPGPDPRVRFFNIALQLPNDLVTLLCQVNYGGRRHGISAADQLAALDEILNPPPAADPTWEEHEHN